MLNFNHLLDNLTHKGTHGQIEWKANLDAYPGWTTVNSCTVTVTANGK